MTKTWQVFSDGRNNFRWQSSSSTSTQKALNQKPKPNSPSHHHLPSVSSVLLQGYSKMYSTENRSDNCATELRKSVVAKQSSLAKASTFVGDQYTGYSTGMFRTGSGKPVAIKQSSLSKAQSMFGGQDDVTYIDTDREEGSFGRDHETSSMFQTGSGKAVNICSTGLIKARNLLGLEENIDDDDYASKDREQSSKHANTVETLTCLKPPTGLGKAVVIKQSSLAKASTFLGDQNTGYSKLEDNSKVVGATGIFRTGSGKPVAFKQSSLSRAQSMFGDQHDDTFADTGCLKVCDDSNNKAETSFTFQPGARNLLDDALPFSGYSKLEDNSKVVGTTGIFRTGSGKPVAIKQSSLSKAQSMFGGQDNDAFLDTGCLKVPENCNNKAETSLTFQSGSRNLVDDPLPFSDWAGGSFGRDDGTTSMFRIGSGKAVNIGSTGLSKARTLLGLEENLDDTSKGLEQSGNHANAGETFTCQEATPVPNSLLKIQSGEYGGEMMKITNGSVHCASRPPPIKFQTAGGRSVKVSADALKRARSLLGDPDLGDFLKEGDAGSPALSCNNMFNKENNARPSCSDGISKVTHMSSNFISPLRSALHDKKNAVRLGKNLIKEFDAAEHDTDMPCSSAALTENTPPALEGVRRATFKNGRTVGVSSVRKFSSAPLVNISNTIGLNNIRVTGDKRKLPNQKYPTPFKKPRNSKFISPLNTKSTVVPNGTMPKLPERKCSKISVSARYPFQYHRKYIKEYLGEPPYFQNMIVNLPEWLRKINPEHADKHMFEDEFGLKSIGLDSFFYILGQSGCSTLSKEWTANHYRWIVWKLACYERCYPAKFSGKLFTADNVLEELKYRYEREVNNGHKSALKRILEGDAPPSSPLILCIASIQLKRVAESDIEVLSTSKVADNSTVTSIELTDGWYSVKGLLDELLLRQVVAKKLFVGQKIRIWGARLCGWNAPVSPLEASRGISLCLHINGTYRAHWADRLGFCKSGCPPLAFKCIKESGGVVPSTLVGVTRVYPVLYRERLSNGSFVVRSERMESKAVQLYEQRRSNIVESVMSEFQWGLKSFQVDNGQNTGDEGEKLFQLLEQVAEPELIMADMSKEQLLAFAAYQAKVEATRQSEMQKSIEMALEEAGLSRRKVDTLMRVRVVGLTNRSSTQRSCSLQGLITIWNPTEQQQSELVEGQAYVVAGLTPNASESNTIYLHDRGSTSSWQPLSLSTLRQYQPFFNPRKSVSLLKMGEVPLFSEFDVAAFVIYVGEVHKSTHQKTQWIFVADGSHSLSDDLLAISFRSPSVDCDSIIPINHNLVGSTVGFCNLIKCAKDERNNIWVAEAIDNSTYFLSYDGINSRHFKNAAACAARWAKASTLMIEKLKRKVSSVVAR